MSIYNYSTWQDERLFRNLPKECKRLLAVANEANYRFYLLEGLLQQRQAFVTTKAILEEQ